MGGGRHLAAHPGFGAGIVKRGLARLAAACLLFALAACAPNITPAPTVPPPTASPTSTTRPTSTPRPTSTCTATAQPTPTLTPRPKPTSTPASQPTPTPQLSPGPDPRIFSFTATPDSGLNIGDEVLLSWEVQGERAELSWYDHHGQLEGWREVPLSGATTVKLRDEDPVADHWVDFKLYVVRESGVYTYTERRLRVTLTCRLTWFFSPAPEGCPMEAPDRASLLSQRFEGGVILGDATHVRVYLDEPGQPYLSFGLRQLPQADLSEETAPSGRFLPAPEFSGLWTGFFPGHEDLRDRLGWATAPAETFESARQCAVPEQGGPPRDCFQLGADGQVYHAHMTGDPQAIWLDDKWPLSYVQGTWKLWSGAKLDG